MYENKSIPLKVDFILRDIVHIDTYNVTHCSIQRDQKFISNVCTWSSLWNVNFKLKLVNKNSERKSKKFNKTHLFIQIFVFFKRNNFNCWFEINLTNFKNRKNRYKCTKILVYINIVKPEACFKDPLSQFMYNLNNYLNDCNNLIVARTRSWNVKKS